MKKILLMMILCLMMSASVSAESINIVREMNIVTFPSNIGAWQFIKNFGYENYFEPHNIKNNNLFPDNVSDYEFFIPSERSGLGSLGNSRSTGEEVGVMSVSISKSDGVVCGLSFLFNSVSNPNKTVSNAMIAAIGANNFEADRADFERALSTAMQNNRAEYYSKSGGVWYLITKNDQNIGVGWYSIILLSFLYGNG